MVEESKDIREHIRFLKPQDTLTIDRLEKEIVVNMGRNLSIGRKFIRRGR